MLQKVEELRNLVAKNDYEATRLEKLILNEVLSKGELPKEEAYTLIENIYGAASIGFSMLDEFSIQYEVLKSKLKEFAEKNNYHLEPVNYSSPLKIKELEEDVTLLDCKLKIKAILIKSKTISSRIEVEINNIFERLKMVRNNLFLITNYVNNVSVLDRSNSRISEDNE